MNRVNREANTTVLVTLVSCWRRQRHTADLRRPRLQQREDREDFWRRPYGYARRNAARLLPSQSITSIADRRNIMHGLTPYMFCFWLSVWSLSSPATAANSVNTTDDVACENESANP